MKRNALLLILLAALVGTAVVVNQSKQKRLGSAYAGVKMRELLLPELTSTDSINGIRKLRIREGDAQVNLALTDGQWRVAERSNYPAAFDKISRTLMNLRELKIAGTPRIGKSAYGSEKLLAPGEGAAGSTGLSVEMMNDKGDLISNLIAGESTKSSGGASSSSFSGAGEQRLVRVPKDADTVWLINDSLSEVQTAPQEWLDKAFIDVRKLQSVEITSPTPAYSWSASRKDENSEFKFPESANGDELDTAKAGNLATLLSNPTFTDVVPKDKATPEFMKNAIGAKLHTFEGFQYEVKLLEVKEGGKDAEPKDYLSFIVTAEFPKERTPEKDEKEEDKKAKDEAFSANKKTLEEKLEREKKFDGWIYEVSNYVVTTLTKRRSELLREKPKAPPTPQIKIPQPAEGTDPAPSTPPASATTAPVEAPGLPESK